MITMMITIMIINLLTPYSFCMVSKVSLQRYSNLGSRIYWYKFWAPFLKKIRIPTTAKSINMMTANTPKRLPVIARVWDLCDIPLSPSTAHWLMGSGTQLASLKHLDVNMSARSYTEMKLLILPRWSCWLKKSTFSLVSSRGPHDTVNSIWVGRF